MRALVLGLSNDKADYYTKTALFFVCLHSLCFVKMSVCLHEWELSK